MKKLPMILTAALLVLSLAACGGSGGAGGALPEADDPGYIWTISIDDTKSKTYGDGQLTANYTVHLSASKEGGTSPEGDYRGEIRIDYEGVPDAATLFAINFLNGSYDFEGWGESDAFVFTMKPYDHDTMMDFVAASYRGVGAKTAPLIEGIAMYTANGIEWTDSDWTMSLDAGLDGVFGVDAGGDESGGTSSVYTPFGGGSSSTNAPVTLCYSIHFADENTVQLNIWSHGDLDVDLCFTGTLDKVPLRETVAVA